MTPPNQANKALAASEILALRAATGRVSRLLESFRIPPGGPDEERLVAELLVGAQAIWQLHPSLDLVKLAEEEATHRLGRWFGEVLELPRGSDQGALLIGRAAFLACGGGVRWANLLLIDVASLPEEFVVALREAAPQVTPPEAPEQMVGQPYQRWSVRDLLWLIAPVRRDGRSLLSLGHRDINSAS